MKITIRPAPHSKTCAISDRRSSCGKFQDQSHRCATDCPAGYCCEMKHCWEVGEKLRDILIARGHEVLMADKKYRKGSTEGRASENTKKAMKELLSWGPDVHIAIHTNASDKPASHGVRIGYPKERYGSDPKRLAASKRLAECVAAENKKIYWDKGYVTVTNSWDFYELNMPKCPAIYIEGCFANSNERDAHWWHDNMDAIAASYADALEAWWAKEGHALPEEKPAEPVVPQPMPTPIVAVARLKASYIWKLSLWSDPRMTEALDVIKHGVDIQLVSTIPIDGYYPVIYEGQQGYVDKRYVKIQTTTEIPDRVYLRKKPKYIWTLNLWTDTQMTESLAHIATGTVMEKLLEEDIDGYFMVRYEGVIGYVDKRYVEAVS